MNIIVGIATAGRLLVSDRAHLDEELQCLLEALG